jgi:CheY-like chemotaxis protein
MKQIIVCMIWPAGYDDDISLFKELCKEKGYSFHCFSSIALGYKYINDSQPDVVVVKRVVFSQDDGLDLCQQLRQDERYSKLPLIVGWADIRGNSFDEAYSAGANGCFGRVYDIIGIFQMIDNLLEDPTLDRLADQYLK